MMTEKDAVRAAASYVAENQNVFDAAYAANRANTRGASSRDVQRFLRDAVAGGYDQYGVVNLAAKWLVGSEYFDTAVQTAVRNGSVPRGTSTVQAAAFLRQALGMPQVKTPVATPEPAAATLRDEFAAALNGQSGKVKITIEAEVDAIRELLDF